jgi:hypothetical protein
MSSSSIWKRAAARVLRYRHVLARRNDVAGVGSSPGGGHRLRILGGLIAGAVAFTVTASIRGAPAAPAGAGFGYRQ